MAAPDPLYLLPTPAGAWIASAEAAADRLRAFIRLLLAQPASPPWRDPDDVFVRRLGQLGWVQFLAAPRRVSQAPFDDALRSYLPPLSARGCALLADAHGFHLASTGFSDDAADALAALSADIASLHERHQRSLKHTLGISGSAWAMPDAAGHSQLAFWPLHVGEHRFALVTAGVPHLNQPELVDLVWLLHQRYGPLAHPMHHGADTTVS